MVDRLSHSLCADPPTDYLSMASAPTIFQELNAAAHSFAGAIFILLPKYYRHPDQPRLHVDLARIGWIRSSQYQVSDSKSCLLYTGEHRFFGETPRDQRLVAAAPHGTRLFIHYFDGRKFSRAMIWICKRYDHPPLTTSLLHKKFLRELLHADCRNVWQPMIQAHQRAVQIEQLNRVLLIRGYVTARRSSQVTATLEPMVHGSVSQASSHSHPPVASSKIIAAGHTINLGTLTALAKHPSYCVGKGSTLVVGQLQTESKSSSRLTSHFRVRPGTSVAKDSRCVYGAFGRALIQHRARYWFTLDPVITASFSSAGF